MMSPMTRQGVSKRLANDKAWGNSPMGELSRLLIDVDCISIETVASAFGKTHTTFYRWMTSVDEPGGSVEEKKEIVAKCKSIHHLISEGLREGDLPADQETTLKYLQG